MTNILRDPEDFAGIQWSETGSTLPIVGDETVAPDGTATADTLKDNNAGGQGFVGVQQAGVAIALNTVHTMSLFVNPLSTRWVYLDMNAFGAADKFAYFDPTNNAVGSVGAAVSAASIEDMPEGFKRVQFTFLSDAADANGTARIFLAEASGDLTVPLDNSSELSLWGAYLNEGAVADTYVSQAGVTVTAGSLRNPYYIAPHKRATAARAPRGRRGRRGGLRGM